MDSVTWDTIYSGYNRWEKSKFISHNLNGEKAKYIRIIGLGNEHNEWNKIYEVELYGKKKYGQKNPLKLKLKPIYSSYVKTKSTSNRLVDDNLKTSHSFFGIGEYEDFKLAQASYLNNIKLSFYRYKGTTSDQLKWRGKITWPLHSLAELINQIEKGENPYQLKSRLNIKSYISEIDGQPHYYLVIAPEDIKPEEKLPVGIRVATMQGMNFPFYHGWALSNTGIINKLELAANENKMLFCFNMVYQLSKKFFIIFNR